MNRHFFLMCLLLCGFPAVATSASAGTTVFDNANQQFKAGDFAGAAASYQKTLAEEGGPRASVYYNLGNSYQSLKQYGPAILAYERARLLTPRDPDLRANLALARKAAAAFDEGEQRHGWKLAMNYLSRNEWSWIVAISALFIGIIALGCGAFNVSRIPRRFAWGGVTVAGLAIIAGAGTLYLRHDESRRGVVLTENATVRLSPFAEAESLGTPGPGRIVHLGARKGDFQYVEVPGTSLKGWLSKEEVQAVVPFSYESL